VYAEWLRTIDAFLREDLQEAQDHSREAIRHYQCVPFCDCDSQAEVAEQCSGSWQALPWRSFL
jgi:hypothetical protein